MSYEAQKNAAYFTGGVAIGCWLLSLRFATPLQLVLCSFAFLAGIQLARMIWQRRRQR